MRRFVPLIAAGLLATMAVPAVAAPGPAQAATCPFGEWQTLSYRAAIEGVLGPRFAVQDVSGTSHLWLRPDQTFAVIADGFHIAASTGPHQVSLSFSGRESGRFRQEVPGQLRVSVAVWDTYASDITVDGVHVDGPVDVSSLFLWTPPSVVGASATEPGHLTLSDHPNAAPAPEFTYSCDGDQLALQQFHARADAPAIIYQRVGDAQPLPPSSSIGSDAGSTTPAADDAPDSTPDASS